MRDLHSHFLPGVDDGAKDIETTRRMLKKAHDNGVTDIMFTPHYMLDSRYVSPRANNEKIFSEVKKIADEYGINVFLGNEVYCNDQIVDLLKRKEIKTLNDSKYILIEIPLYQKINNAKSIFLEVKSAGLIPILAHPERYASYYDDLDFFLELRSMGVLMQINASSLVGDYGKHAKKMAVKLLKANLISFVGSDMHSDKESKYDYLPKIEKKLKKIVGEHDFIELTVNNFARVVNNVEID
ncbi:MAG: hypothetical protein J1F35_04945 [Erysipelotrichales bacterium]|nr:hypothetical protein [Erysipelotrichales bacterium]